MNSCNFKELVTFGQCILFNNLIHSHWRLICLNVLMRDRPNSDYWFCGSRGLHVTDLN